ncbi:GPI biosynthesis protein family Pig-F-domain-containing protein, partial [Collybia nuda]
MAKSKNKSQKTTSELPRKEGPTKTLDGSEITEFFPFARYTSVVGVQTTLLAFAALFLPRTTFLFELTKPSRDPAFISSRDKPQHPFLEPITLSPTATLASICLGVFMIQGWWGGWVRNWWVDYALRGSHDEKKLDRHLVEKQRGSALRRAWVTTLVASFVLHGILVLFGAPLTSFGVQTYLLALLLSLLMVFTPAYSLGSPTLSNDSQAVVNRMMWIRLFAEFAIKTPVERAIVYPAVGAAVGSWVGIIPIALDWDRPWQAWPLTPAFGAILGYILASMVALTASATTHLAKEHVRSLKPTKI